MRLFSVKLSGPFQKISRPNFKFNTWFNKPNKTQADHFVRSEPVSARTAAIRAEKAAGQPLPPLNKEPNRYIAQKHETKEMTEHRSAAYDKLFNSPLPNRNIPSDELFNFGIKTQRKTDENLRLIQAGLRDY